MLIHGPEAAGGAPSCDAPTHLCGKQLKVLGVHALVETAVLYIHQEAVVHVGRPREYKVGGETVNRSDLFSYPPFPSSNLEGRQLGFSPALRPATSLGLYLDGGWNSEVLNPPLIRNA